jgi:hypothetical protein
MPGPGNRIPRAIAILACLVPALAALPFDSFAARLDSKPLHVFLLQGLLGLMFVFGGGGSAWLAGARGTRLVRISLVAGLLTLFANNVAAAAFAVATTQFGVLSSSTAGWLLLAIFVPLSWVLGVAVKSAADHRHTRVTCAACQEEFSFTPGLYLRAFWGHYTCPLCDGALRIRHRWFYWLWIGFSALMLGTAGTWALIIDGWPRLLVVLLVGSVVLFVFDWLMERYFSMAAPRDLVPLSNNGIEQNAAR